MSETLKLESEQFGTLEVRDGATLGREEVSDVVLDHDSVSRRHCTIRREAEGWVVEDLVSASGTWVNETNAFRPLPLRPGDVLRIGTVRLVVSAP